MKVVVIGASGTIGSALVAALEAAHEVVRAARSGPLKVDMADPASIAALFASVRDIDAVACCAASAPLTPLAELSGDAFARTVAGKLHGQVNLVHQALRHLRDGGSITLTSGSFARQIPGSAAGALVNAGLEAFVRAAARELPRGLRLNVVSPGWVAETLEKLGMSPGGTSAADVARAYVAAIDGAMSGETIRPGAS